jgi:DNA-binding NarL/FixJ family response regulator
MTNKAGKKIRIMLVEDHILIRMGLVTASQLEPDIELVAEVEEGEEAVECYRTHRPDVVIMDLRLPGMDGVQTISALRREFGSVVVLVLSTYAADDDVYRAIQAGAAGYLLKDMPLKTLVEAIRSVYAGHNYFPPGISARLADRLRQAVPTDRELIVLQKIAKGMSNKEIGAELGITEGTVKAHVTNILSKLHAADRTQAVTTAIKRGMIHID